jgi:hypothetical protein
MTLKKTAIAFLLSCLPLAVLAQPASSHSSSKTAAPSHAVTDHAATQSGDVLAATADTASSDSTASDATPTPTPARTTASGEVQHIAIASPVPVAQWTIPERIAWAANLILVLVAIVAIYVAISLLRKIDRMTGYVEIAAESAQESAKAALHFAETHARLQAQMDRPWVAVTAVPMPGVPNSFNVVAANRGRTPARVLSHLDEIVIVKDETQLPEEPLYREEDRSQQAPLLLLPGESFVVRSFRREDVKSICDTEDQIHRVEEWESRIYFYGNISYTGLADREDDPAHQTSWCCWYIHGRQKSGMVMAGPRAYNQHT